MQEPRRVPSLVLHDDDVRNLTSALNIFLPPALSSEEFLALLSPSASGQPAYNFPAFDNWFSKTLKSLTLQKNEAHPFNKHPYHLREIHVQAVDWFWRNRPGHEDRLGFMKLQTKVETDPYLHDGEDRPKADWIPGAVFLRGGSVAILIIVQPADAKADEEKHMIFTIQPRIAAGSLAFTEIPAGMLDGNSFKGTAASEIEEEAKLCVKESDLINMSELALEDEDSSTATTADTELTTEKAMYPSAGACDEFIPLFLCQKRLTRRHMEWLKGKATGLAGEGENITLKLVPLPRAWKDGARDAKALAALALYENLKREGKIRDMPDDVESEPDDWAK